MWRFTMHGPDGTDNPNRIVFRTIEPKTRELGAGDSDGDTIHISVADTGIGIPAGLTNTGSAANATEDRDHRRERCFCRIGLLASPRQSSSITLPRQSDLDRTHERVHGRVAEIPAEIQSV